MPRRRPVKTQLPTGPLAWKAIRAAEGQPFSVRKDGRLASDRPLARGNLLLLNSKRCAVAQANNLFWPSKQSRRPYSRLGVYRSTLENVDALIVLQEVELPDGAKVERTLIIPAAVLLASFRQNQEKKWFFLPTTQKTPRRHSSKRINWWSYIDAWDTLR